MNKKIIMEFQLLSELQQIIVQMKLKINQSNKKILSLKKITKLD